MASEPGRHLESSKRADHGLLSLVPFPLRLRLSSRPSVCFLSLSWPRSTLTSRPFSCCRYTTWLALPSSHYTDPTSRLPVPSSPRSYRHLHVDAV